MIVTRPCTNKRGLGTTAMMKLIFTKLVNLVSSQLSHHKLMGVQGSAFSGFSGFQAGPFLRSVQI